MQKQLLITSDDMGMCHAVNTGIVRAMTEGFVASSNFLAPAPWFHEAVDLALEHKLEMGVHLCLTCDWDRLKWGPITANPRLCVEDGRLPALHSAIFSPSTMISTSPRETKQSSFTISPWRVSVVPAATSRHWPASISRRV